MPGDIDRADRGYWLSPDQKPNDDQSGSTSYFATERIKGIVDRMIQSPTGFQLPI